MAGSGWRRLGRVDHLRLAVDQLQGPPAGASTAGSWRAATDRGSTASKAPTATSAEGGHQQRVEAPRPAAVVVANG